MSGGEPIPSHPLASELLSRRHAVVEASAGTGKTFLIEQVAAELVARGAVRLDQLLVVTFTEKAAAELRARVRRLFERLAGAPEAAAPGCWRLDAEGRARVAAALRSADAAPIGTIHAFCHGVLRDHAFAGGRLLDEELADEGARFTRAFQDVLRAAPRDEELRAALALWTGEGAKLADLEALVHDCHRLRGPIAPAWSEEAIEAALSALPSLTEARAAAGEVSRPCVAKTRLALEIVYGILASWRASAGRPASERFAIVLRLWRDDGERMTRSDPVPLRYARKQLEHALARGAPVERLTSALSGLCAAAPGVTPYVTALARDRVEARLAREQQERGGIDFHAMLAEVDRALGLPDSPLLPALRARYRVALIDEFQDTDELQWRIFRRVFSSSPDGHSLYLVGDPKQAIYAFRGGDVESCLAARRDLLAPGEEPFRLSENFRSTAPLLEALNQILDQTAQEPFFEGEIRYDTPVRCGRPELTFEDAARPEPVHLLPTQEDRAAQGVLIPPLARTIAAEIHRLIGGPAPARIDGEPVRARDVFVLAQKRAELELVAAELRRAGVPFAFYKQAGLFQTAEARHLEDVLAAVADPGDREARFRAYLTPFFGLALADLPAAADLPESHPALARLRRFARLAGERHPAALARALLTESGLVRRLIAFGDGERSLANYLQVLELLQRGAGEGAGAARMAGTLRALRQGQLQPPGEEEDLQRLSTDEEAVQLLTLHAAKGLEAAVVFVAGGFTAGRGGGARPVHLPPEGRRHVLVGPEPEPWRLRAAAEAAREEERLLYVALTRARGRLYLPFLGVFDPKRPAETEEAGRITGPYRHVNRRLRTLLAGGLARAPLFRIVAAGARPPEARAPAGAPLTLPAGLLDEPEGDDWAELRRRHAGFVTTSFSGLARRLPVEEEPADARADGPDRARPGPDELPGGATSGSFLHELLARVAPEAALASPSPEALGRHPEVAWLLQDAARRFDIPARFHGHALALVHAALASPVALGGEVVPGLASVPALRREVEFLFPIPDGQPPPRAAGDREPPPFTVRRGFIVGFIDLLFTHGGRVYFGDWKSNCLPAFEGEKLAEGFSPYELQARLYTLAVLRMLRLRSAAEYEARFGGFAFLFLRGLSPSGTGREGVYFRRPAFAEVRGWERELAALSYGEAA